MKPKTMILLVLAVGCGLGASFMTSRLLAERGNTEDPEKVSVLVARKDLATGASIVNPQDMFAPKEFNRGQEPKGAIENHDQLKGKVLKQALREGDHVRPEDLMSDKDQWMTYLLPKGYRAIGLRVNIQDTAGGFAALPLSRVDLLSTVRKPNDKESYCHTLLQNVLVLAADQTMHAEQGKGAMPATTVTLAVTPEEAQRVFLAQQMGPLSLALRSFQDKQKVEVSKTTGDSLHGGERPDLTPQLPAEPARAETKTTEPVVEAPKTKTHVTLVMNGDRQELVEYKLDEKDRVISSRVLPREGGAASRVDGERRGVSPTWPPPPAVNPPVNPPAAPPANPGPLPRADLERQGNQRS